MSSTRYGIYLRPDPATCWAQTQIILALKQQYGLVSAAAFPPHATLVGNLRTEASVDELFKRVGAALASWPSFQVFNKGIERFGADAGCVGDGYLYNIHENGRGEPNESLVRLAASVKNAVLPVALPTRDYLVATVAESEFWGHLSLASHDLLVDSTLSDEVGEFLADLPVTAPASFSAQVVSLYETTSRDWNGHWWKTLRCIHRKSWTLS